MFDTALVEFFEVLLKLVTLEVASLIPFLRSPTEAESRNDRSVNIEAIYFGYLYFTIYLQKRKGNYTLPSKSFNFASPCAVIFLIRSAHSLGVIG